MSASSAPSETYDVAVVGGGLAGLAAAATAARAGGTVVVLVGQQLGGRATTTVLDGFGLNQGPHALYRSGAGMATLRRLGVSPVGRPPDVRKAFGRRAGEVHPMPTHPRALLRTPLLASPAARWELARIMGRIRSRGFDPAVYAGQSFGAWLGEHVGHDDVADLVRTMVRLTTYVGNADALDAAAALAQVRLGITNGVLYLHGGWGRLVDRLAVEAREAGVTIETGATAIAVEPGGPLASGGRDTWTVCASDERLGVREYHARTVVVAGGRPSVAARLLGLGERWNRLAPQCASVLDVGLADGRGGPPERNIILGVDRPLYASLHEPPADLAPPGHSLVSALRYHDVDGDPDGVAAVVPDGIEPSGETEPEPEPEPEPSGSAETRQTVGPTTDHHVESRAELTALVEAMGTDPAQAVVQRYLHRMVVCTGLPTPESGGMAGRPSIAVDGRPGVFVAGDWVGPDGLLADGALASGEAAGLAALERAHQLRPGAAGSIPRSSRPTQAAAGVGPGPGLRLRLG